MDIDIIFILYFRPSYIPLYVSYHSITREKIVSLIVSFVCICMCVCMWLYCSHTNDDRKCFVISKVLQDMFTQKQTMRVPFLGY